MKFPPLEVLSWWTEKVALIFNVPSEDEHYKYFLSQCALAVL